MFLWTSVKPFSIFLASYWLPNTDITLKVDGILRRRYAGCKMALKVFRRPLPKIALYGYVISTTSKVMNFVQGFWECSKDTESVIAPTVSILLLSKS
jgi:hypothetical protein